MDLSKIRSSRRYEKIVYLLNKVTYGIFHFLETSATFQTSMKLQDLINFFRNRKESDQMYHWDHYYSFVDLKIETDKEMNMVLSMLYEAAIESYELAHHIAICCSRRAVREMSNYVYHFTNNFQNFIYEKMKTFGIDIDFNHHLSDYQLEKYLNISMTLSAYERHKQLDLEKNLTSWNQSQNNKAEFLGFIKFITLLYQSSQWFSIQNIQNLMMLALKSKDELLIESIYWLLVIDGFYIEMKTSEHIGKSEIFHLKTMDYFFNIIDKLSRDDSISKEKRILLTQLLFLRQVWLINPEGHRLCNHMKFVLLKKNFSISTKVLSCIVQQIMDDLEVHLYPFKNENYMRNLLTSNSSS